MINSAPENQGSGRKLFYGLFIFPLLIAVGMAVLLCTVVLLTREVETPESLISAIKTGSPSKRWQKAFELSNELNRERGLIRAAGVMNEVVHILNDRVEYDAQTRSYMAMALARFDDPLVVPALEQALRVENEPDVQVHLIWSLGAKEARSSIDLITGFLVNDRPEIRKVAVYVLGVLKAQSAISEVQKLLNDKEMDVQWNAALSLARLGDDAGYETILIMLDRESLESILGSDQAKIEEIMINATKGLGYLKKPESKDVLIKLSQNDQSLKVRQIAIESIKLLAA